MKDFVNTFLITVINEAKSSNTMKDKRKLLRLKYNAIFMDEGLTDIAIKNKFKFTNKPLLVNNEKLRYTGISLNEYLKKLDGVLTEWLHDEIMSAVIKVYDLELNDVDIADGVLIKTIANLINDKKKCLGQLVVTTPDMSDNIKNAATSINKTLFKTKSGDRN